MVWEPPHRSCSVGQPCTEGMHLCCTADRLSNTAVHTLAVRRVLVPDCEFGERGGAVVDDELRVLDAAALGLLERHHRRERAALVGSLGRHHGVPHGHPGLMWLAQRCAHDQDAPLALRVGRRVDVTLARVEREIRAHAKQLAK
eukprot:140526-Prymnesium_polylepis.1